MKRGHHELSSDAGLRAVFTDEACLARLDAGDTSLLMYPASAHEAGPANLYLRRIDGASATWVPLLGPASPSAVAWSGNGPTATGEWEGLRYAVSFRLAAGSPAWFWHVTVENTGDERGRRRRRPHARPRPRAIRCGPQQRVLREPVPRPHPREHGTGTAVAVRQNMPGADGPVAARGFADAGAGLGDRHPPAGP